MVAKVTTYLSKQRPISIVSWAMALVATIGFLDYVTGYEVHLAAFYVAPISLAAWYAGRLSGIIVAIASVITTLFADIAAGYMVSHPAIILWNTDALVGFFIVLVIVLVKLRMANETLESLIQMVAHDLKSPVISMVGLVRALRGHCRRLPLDEKRDRILDQLESSGETMEKFLKDLLPCPNLIQRRGTEVVMEGGNITLIQNDLRLLPSAIQIYVQSIRVFKQNLF
jgi:signal transduction histidine kinase